MTFNYKDLTYIRSALQNLEGELARKTPSECGEDEFSEIQDDILYLRRLIALTAAEIADWETRGGN